jgi:hypothetical protein
MDRSPRDASADGRTSDGMLVAIPIFAMLLVIFPIGPIGAPAGMLLAVISLLLARGRTPSKNRTNLIACSVMALIGTIVFTVAQIVDWLR